MNPLNTQDSEREYQLIKPTGKAGELELVKKIKKLIQREKFSEQIIQNSSEAIVILDKERTIKTWSTGAAKLFGFSQEEAVDKTIDLIIPKNKIPENKQLNKIIFEKGYADNFETKRKAKNKTFIDVSITVKKVTDEKDDFLGYLAIYHDITEQKKTNFTLQKRFEAMQDAYKELGLQRRKMDYLYEILDLATSEKNISALAQLIVSAACMLTKCNGAVLRTYDEKSKSLCLESSIGVNEKWQSKGRHPLKNALAEKGFKNKRPTIISNVNKNRKHHSERLLKSHQFKTLITIPLFIDKKIIGSLNLYSQHPEHFRFMETDFLEKFGKQCSLAMYTKLC